MARWRIPGVTAPKLRARADSTSSGEQPNSSAIARTEPPANRNRNALRSRSRVAAGSLNGITCAMRVSHSGEPYIPGDVADSRAAALAVRPLLIARRRFAVGVVGGGKTEALAAMATEAAHEFGIPISYAAVLAHEEAVTYALQCAIGDAVDPTARQAFFPHLAGTVLAIAHAHSWQLPLVKAGHRRRVIEHHLALIRRAAGLSEEEAAKFLRGRKDDVAAALDLDLRARLAERQAPELFAEMIGDGQRLPALSFVLEAIETYRGFKARERIVDAADVFAGQLVAEAECPLVLIDEAQEVPPLARRAVARLFPRAGVMFATSEIAAVAQWFDALPDGARLTLELPDGFG